MQDEYDTADIMDGKTPGPKANLDPHSFKKPRQKQNLSFVLDLRSETDFPADLPVRTVAAAEEIQKNRRNSKNRLGEPGIVLATYSVLEAIAIFAGYYLVSLIRLESGTDLFNLHLSIGALAVGAYCLSQSRSGLFKSSCMRKLRVRLGQSLKLYLFMFASLLAIGFALKVNETFSRIVLGTYLVWGVAVITAGHVILRSFRTRLIGSSASERVAIYGASSNTLNLIEEMKVIDPFCRVVGVYDDRMKPRHLGASLVPFTGSLSDLLHEAKIGRIDTVVMNLASSSNERIEQITTQLSAVSINIRYAFRTFQAHKSTPKVQLLGDSLVIELLEKPISNFENLQKRALDFVLSLFGLIILSPLLILTTIAIKLDSRGPVIFVQKRFGFNNNEISVFKFRTMTVNKQDVSGAMRTTKGDARVTRVGRVLRRLSIDELPQIFNVLRGEMSLVGPRPHAVAMLVGEELYHERYKEYAARHRVRPGITGWAQVNGSRGEVDSDEKARKRIALDLYYIDNWTVGFDLWIMLRTIYCLFSDSDAY